VSRLEIVGTSATTSVIRTGSRPRSRSTAVIGEAGSVHAGASMTRRAVILVEGDSDRIALETLAARLGHDLPTEGVEIVAMDGVTNVGSYVARFAANVNLTVLCDERESPMVRRAAERAGVGGLRIHTCVADLEDELIRALGVTAVEQVIEAQGELASFRALQRMPAHRGGATEQHLHRFIGTKSGRKARYARLLVEALDLTQAPQPLIGALVDAVGNR
jgi:hypothetical protein